MIIGNIQPFYMPTQIDMNKVNGIISAAGQRTLPCCAWIAIPFFKFLSTSDISVTFAFYNGLTKGIEV